MGSFSGTGPTLDLQTFLARVQAVRVELNELARNRGQMAAYHQRALGSVGQPVSDDVDSYTSHMQARNRGLRDQIKELQQDVAKSAQSSVRETKRKHLNSLRSVFQQHLREYQEIEVDYRKRYRDQIARQYRIVNPEASEAEIQAAVEMDWGDEGVFQAQVLPIQRQSL